MDIIESQSLIDNISRAIYNALPRGWETATVTVTARTDRLLEVGGKYVDKRKNSHIWNDVPDEAGELSLKLRKGMAVANPDSRWHQMIITLTRKKPSAETKFIYND